MAYYRQAKSKFVPFYLRDLRKEDRRSPQEVAEDTDREYSLLSTPKSYDSFGSEASEESLTPPPSTEIFGLRAKAEDWNTLFNASHPLPSDDSSTEYWSLGLDFWSWF